MLPELLRQEAWSQAEKGLLWSVVVLCKSVPRGGTPAHRAVCQELMVQNEPRSGAKEALHQHVTDLLKTCICPSCIAALAALWPKRGLEGRPSCLVCRWSPSITYLCRVCFFTGLYDQICSTFEPSVITRANKSCRRWLFFFFWGGASLKGIWKLQI